MASFDKPLCPHTLRWAERWAREDWAEETMADQLSVFADEAEKVALTALCRRSPLQRCADESLSPFEQEVWSATYANSMAILLNIEARLKAARSDADIEAKMLECAKQAATRADAAVGALRLHVKATGRLGGVR